MLDLRLLFVALIWGINFSIVKFALADFHPLTFTVVRFALAAVFLFIVMLLGRESFHIDRRDRFALTGLGFLGITLYNIFFMYGLKYTTASNSALLISLSPLFGALISAGSGKERLTFRISSGLTLATAGVILIIRSRHGEPSPSSSGIAGDLLTLCATLTWALYTITAKPLLEKYSAIKVTAYSMAAGSILLLPLSLPALRHQRWSAVSIASWAAMAFAAFLAAGVAYVFWYQGVKRIGVTRTMVYHYIMPFAAVFFAAYALEERITLLQIAGGSSILAGVYLVQKKTPDPEMEGTGTK
ncbi:MAG: DMT family transporter [Desulfobacteraceae bacterium]|nr:DMT family transporter [Desulfobacteraceae bacterium]